MEGSVEVGDKPDELGLIHGAAAVLVVLVKLLQHKLAQRQRISAWARHATSDEQRARVGA